MTFYDKKYILIILT